MKYNEDNILNEVGEYISSTYDQHYVGTKNIQTIDVWDNLDMAEEMCLGTLLKYAMRFGKKGGKKKGDKPRRMYFHAFGGKAAQINQINAACRGTDEVFYGFAPCVNFRSPKTADVIRAIGIDSLVLESDRENYMAVREDLEANAQFIADALYMHKDEVVQKTAANARRFYGLA